MLRRRGKPVTNQQLIWGKRGKESSDLLHATDTGISYCLVNHRAFKTSQQHHKFHQLLNNTSPVTLVKIINFWLIVNFLTVTYFCRVGCLLQNILKSLEPLYLFTCIITHNTLNNIYLDKFCSSNSHHNNVSPPHLSTKRFEQHVVLCVKVVT